MKSIMAGLKLGFITIVITGVCVLPMFSAFSFSQDGAELNGGDLFVYPYEGVDVNVDYSKASDDFNNSSLGINQDILMGMWHRAACIRKVPQHHIDRGHPGITPKFITIFAVDEPDNFEGDMLFYSNGVNKQFVKYPNVKPSEEGGFSFQGPHDVSINDDNRSLKFSYRLNDDPDSGSKVITECRFVDDAELLCHTEEVYGTKEDVSNRFSDKRTYEKMINKTVYNFCFYVPVLMAGELAN